jgi:hypothetical protein
VKSTTLSASSMLAMFIIFTSVSSVISSFPSTYLVEFSTSQLNGCRVVIDNPLARTGLGVVGTWGGGVGFWGGAIAKVVELTVPKTSDIFRGDICK